jgi:glycosyltransferase involved in cell wall biosynthesis
MPSDAPVAPATIFMAAYTNYRRDPRVRREAEALVERGHRVVFLASRQRGEPDRETIAGVEVIKAPGLQKKTSIALYLLDYAIFTLMIMAHLMVRPRRYRLIHINNMPDFLVFATWLPRLLGVPVIHDIHDLMPELFEEKFGAGRRRWIVSIIRAQERWAGRFASAVLTVEDRLRDILGNRGIPREKIHVLMNLPDDRIFAPRGMLPAKPDGAPFVLVYHGTLAHRLGLDVAIRAVAQARAQAPNLQLRIIGGGEERSALVALRDELGLGDAVSFSDGFVPVQTIPGLIADADLGLCPLRISGGTDIMLPTKLLEYVTVGIPCIVPKTGTIARYFDDTMVQFFDAENVESLAAAIVALQRDPQRRESLAREATRRFADTYRWTRHKLVYTGLVERLIGPPAAR